MVMATVLDIRGGARGYVAPVRAATVEREADEGLEPQDISDLIFIWQGAEAACGVRSTFGEQCDRAAEAMPTQDAVLDARRYQRERVRAWVSLGHDANAPGSPRFDVECMPVKPTPPTVNADPYEGIVGFSHDNGCNAVARAGRVRSRLLRCSEGSRRVLFAVYGPPKGNEKERRSARMKFGDLVEVVVALVAFQRSENDPPARAIVSAKLTDDSFVRVMKTRAAGMLRTAARDYAGAR